MVRKIGDSTADTVLLVRGNEVRVHRQVLEARSHRFNAIFSRKWNPEITEYSEEIVHLYLSFLYDNEVDFTRDQLEGLYDLAFSYHEVPLIRFIERKLQEWNFWQPDVFLTFSEHVRFIFANSVTVTEDNVDNLLALVNAGNGNTMDSTKLQEKCDEFLDNNLIEKFKSFSLTQRNNAICRLKQIIINNLQSSDKEFLSTYTLWVETLRAECAKPDEKYPSFEVLLDYFDLCISYPPCLGNVWTLDSLVDVVQQQFKWFRNSHMSTSHSKFVGRFQKCLDTLDKHRGRFGDLWSQFCTHLAYRNQFRWNLCYTEWKEVLLHWEKLGPDFVLQFAKNFSFWLPNFTRSTDLNSRLPFYKLCNSPPYVSFFETLARTECVAQRKASLGEMILETHWIMFEIRDLAPVLGQFYFDTLEEHLFDVIKVKGFQYKLYTMCHVVDQLCSGNPRYVDLEPKFAEYVNLNFSDISNYVNKFSARPKMMMVVGKLLAKKIETQYCTPNWYQAICCSSTIEALKKIDGFVYLDPCPLWTLFALYDQAQEYREQILEPRNFDQYLTHRIQTDGFDFECKHEKMERNFAKNKPSYVTFEVKFDQNRNEAKGMQHIVDQLCSGNPRYVDLESKFAEYANLELSSIANYVNKFSTRPKMMMAVGKLLAKEIETQYCNPNWYRAICSTSTIEALEKVDGFAYLDPCPLWALFALRDEADEYREEILEPRNFDQYVTHRIRTDGFDFECEHDGMQRIIGYLWFNDPRYVKFEAEFAQNVRITAENAALFASKFDIRPRMWEALKRFEAQQANVDKLEKRDDNFGPDSTSTKKQRTE